jgi:hypothetical protein
MRVSLVLILLGLPLLAGCGGMAPKSYSVPEGRRLEAEFEQAWDALVRVLLERRFSFRLLDPQTGSLETTWTTVNADYAASVLVTQSDDRYSHCGRPGVGEAFREKSARIVGVLAPHPRAGTHITMRAEFRTQRYSTLGLGPDKLLGTAECRSRGWLEDELAVQTQVRAVKDRLERARRDAY